MCALAWRRPGRPVWLAIDLPGAVRVREIDDPDHEPSLGAGSVLIAGSGCECRQLGGGGLLVGGGAFWSLFDPARPQAPAVDDDTGRVAVETALRHAARRFSERARWYRELDQTLRDAVRRDLTAGPPTLAPLPGSSRRGPASRCSAARPARRKPRLRRRSRCRRSNPAM